MENQKNNFEKKIWNRGWSISGAWKIKLANAGDEEHIGNMNPALREDGFHKNSTA
jgi:hypothetical protein